MMAPEHIKTVEKLVEEINAVWTPKKQAWKFYLQRHRIAYITTHGNVPAIGFLNQTMFTIYFTRADFDRDHNTIKLYVYGMFIGMIGVEEQCI